MGGVEEAEQHTQRPYDNHLPTAVEHQRQTDQTRQRRRRNQRLLHRIGRHPTLCTSTLRAQSLLVVGALAEVEIVVHEVGVDLHHEGKQETQHHRQNPHLALRVADGQSGTNHYRNGSTGQRLRACCQQPSLPRILSYVILVHILFLLISQISLIIVFLACKSS